MSEANSPAPACYAASQKDLEERGFVNYSGGSVLRRVYRDFVIDAKMSALGGYRDLELRAGSDAARVQMRLSSIADLDCLLAMIERRDAA